MGKTKEDTTIEEKRYIESLYEKGDYDFENDEARYIESLYNKQHHESLSGISGLGNTYHHQIIQTRILDNYLRRFDKKILTETHISNTIHITPDISIWSEYNYNKGIVKNPILTIEITHTIQNDRYSKRVILKSFEITPSLQEAFIYNYKEGQWTRYSRRDELIEEHDKEDYSQVLKCHLHTLLK